MKNLLNGLLKTRRRPRRHPPKPTAGYTMIELLVGMVIAALIITPMLAFVVNVLNSDVKEQAKTNSEQELQLALDYISQDISQAVYVYDEAGMTEIADQLPSSSGGTTRDPVLVFWKRQFVEDALSFSGDICASSDPDECNDTFVYSLVAYYLVEDDSNTWCEPAGNCKRIGRFQIQDGVKDIDGNYVCGTDGDDTSVCDPNDDKETEFMRDQGFADYNAEPTLWEKDSAETYTNNVDILVNYIEDFELSNPTLITDSDNKLAEIKIQSNAMRRLQTDTNCGDSPTYCPQATAQVGARSGFGTSE